MRSAAISAFVRCHGFGDARITLLAQDASHRRYWRLTGGPRDAVVMDAPPQHEELGPYLWVGSHLRAAGLSVPDVLAADPAAGLLLLEDMGDALFPAVLTESTQTNLYDAATDTLAALHAIPLDAACQGQLPRWTAAEMVPATAATFLDWWWPATFGSAPDAAIRGDFAAAMHRMLAPLEEQPPVLVHRDYFAGNLFWLPDRPGPRRVGVIDFQDAALGPAAYDLVSLVQDARRDLPATLLQRQRARYLAARPALELATFHSHLAICGAQRHLRVAALWVRLARRDGKPAYLAHGPRCWAMLEECLQHPAAAALAEFMDRHVPPPLRRNPQPAGVAVPA